MYHKEPSGATAGSCGQELGVGTSHSRICTPAPAAVAASAKNGISAPKTIRNLESHPDFIRDCPLSKNVPGMRHCQEGIDALPCVIPARPALVLTKGGACGVRLKDVSFFVPKRLEMKKNLPPFNYFALIDFQLDKKDAYISINYEEFIFGMHHASNQERSSP